MEMMAILVNKDQYFKHIKTEHIHNDLWDARINPDYSDTDDQFLTLKDNINENGLLVPINVAKIDNNKYSITDGRRRFEAMKQLKYKEIKCFVTEAQTQGEMAAISLIANIHRKGLDDVERSRGIIAVFQTVGFSINDIILNCKRVHNKDENVDPRFIKTLKMIGYSANYIYQLVQLIRDIPISILQYAQKKGLYTIQKILLTHTKLRDHPQIQKELVDDLSKTKDLKLSRILVYQTIRDLETGALYKSGKSYNVHTHLRDKIDETQVEYTPYKNYFEIMKHSNELLRYLTGHPLTKGEYDYTKDHINYSAQHRIDIVKTLDSRSIVGLMEHLRMLRYAMEALESLVSEGVNQNT